MVLNCRHVWDQISNYIEDDVAPELREAIEAAPCPLPPLRRRPGFHAEHSLFDCR